MATSFKTRKALGQRYAQDPAALLESERLQALYAQLPAKEARALQESQFARSLTYNTEQADLNRAAQREAQDAAAQSAMVGTIGNVALTGGILRAMTKAEGEPFFPDSVKPWKWFDGGAEQALKTTTPTEAATLATPSTTQTGVTAGQIAAGSLAANAGGYFNQGVGLVNPASFPLVEGGAPAGGGFGGVTFSSPATLGVDTPALVAEGGGVGAGAAAGGGGAGMSSLASPAGVGAAAGYGAEMLANAITGGSGKNVGARVAGGALAGAAVGGPVGAVVGSLVGVVSAAAEDVIGTVICTELYRQGLMEEETYLADSEFGRTLDADVWAGYHLWAVPLARWMSKSKTVTWILKRPALAWANHIAGKKNPVGWALLTVGVPVCRFIGRVVRVEEVAHG